LFAASAPRPHHVHWRRIAAAPISNGFPCGSQGLKQLGPLEAARKRATGLDGCRALQTGRAEFCCNFGPLSVPMLPVCGCTLGHALLYSSDIGIDSTYEVVHDILDERPTRSDGHAGKL
jgi:hypothetical protein